MARWLTFGGSGSWNRSASATREAIIVLSLSQTSDFRPNLRTSAHQHVSTSVRQHFRTSARQHLLLAPRLEFEELVELRPEGADGLDRRGAVRAQEDQELAHVIVAHQQDL